MSIKNCIKVIQQNRRSRLLGGRKVMTISERIFERLRQLSMTKRKFAEKAGIQQSTISAWKKNKTNPSSDKILAICKALDVSPEWLLSGVDNITYK
jgi:transcriptional regulator with XRE-family HTH domain